MRTLKIKVPGSCGEFVQGFFDGEPVLITCPIEKFTTVTVSAEFSGVEGLGEKSLAMLEKTLRLLNVDEFKFGLRLETELPRSKGMASSSADLAAVAKAAALALGKDLSAEEIAALAASIEPTDGVFFKGIMAMNPISGRTLKKISLPEKFIVAIFDYGGAVDTLKLNRRSAFEIPSLEFNPALVEESARMNQQILYKPALEEIIDFAKNLGAVTVNVAHSGTVIGIFFRAEDFIDGKIFEIGRRFDFLKFMTKTKVIDGGIYAEI